MSEQHTTGGQPPPAEQARAPAYESSTDGRHAFPRQEGIDAERDAATVGNVVGMTAPTLLTLRAIAERVGVKERTIRNYHQVAERRRRDDAVRPGDFPPPDDRFGNTPVWKASTIRRWQARRPGRGAGGGRPTKGERMKDARACGPDPTSWFGRGAWPTCKCGYAPRDNGLLTAHWREQGFEVVDEHGRLVTRAVRQ